MFKHYKVIDLKQGTPEWLAYRRNGVGASDIPSIMELPDSYLSRDQVLDQKITGKGVETTAFIEQVFLDGHQWEESFRNTINQEQGFNFVPMVIESVYNPKFFASLDGICEKTNQILEVKSTKNKKFIDLVTKGEAPPIWYAQIQWQLYIANISNALLCVVNTIDKSHHVIRVSRERDYIDEMIKIANEFIVDLESGQNPIKHINVNEAVLNLVFYKDQIKLLENQIDHYKNMVDEVSAMLLNQYQARKLTCDLIDIQEVTRKGSVQYQNIPELFGVNLDYYRKPDSKYITVKVKETKQKKIGDNENE